MLKTLRLERFKNFEKAELQLGPLTLLVGTNASGKSNIRDAFRFLHGIARGYGVADIFGEKRIGGDLQWSGIRGGPREAAFSGTGTFAIEAELVLPNKLLQGDTLLDENLTYRVEIDPGSNGKAPRVIAERLIADANNVFNSGPAPGDTARKNPLQLEVRLRKSDDSRGPESRVEFPSAKPVLSQILEHPDIKAKWLKNRVRAVLSAFEAMRFLDLSPDAMRIPSFPGQIVLGDRGENLSSVLQAICEAPEHKAALVEWLKALTPMDARDFEFPQDQAGRVLVALVEASGQRISAYSASDGTLRFLAMVAALLGPEPARFYFFEELDNGIHPARLYLLLQLIEQRVGAGNIQMTGTTHSPQLLGLLSPRSREYASLVYRLPEARDARISRVLDIPNAREALEKMSWADLHQSGWLENAVYFGESEGDE